MVKLLNLLKELLEAKQVGTLYHYTNIFSLSKILDTNQLNPHLSAYSDSTHKGREGQKSVSFTRSKHRTFGLADEASIRIILDGDKLSNKYKIIPFQDWLYTGKPETAEDEFEERIYPPGNQPIRNINQYIIKVELLNDYDSLEPETIKYLTDKLDDRNIDWEVINRR